MKFCISFGRLQLKYFFYCFLIVIIEYAYNFISQSGVKILNNHLLFNSFCFFLGYLLNFIPAWISHIKSKEKKNPITNKLKEENTQSIEYIYNKPYENNISTKDILKFGFICFIQLLANFIEIILIKININKGDDNKEINYNDNFSIIEYLIIFIVSKFDKEVYYKHQNCSFLILILVEAIKNIYFLTKTSYHDTTNIIIIILKIIYSISYALYYIYIKDFMKYKFISPAKCNFIIGIIDVPLIIIIYFIISFTSLGIIGSKYYFGNILELFRNFGNINAKDLIFLISLPFVFGIFEFIINKVIYDYTIYHIYIPILIEYLTESFIRNLGFFVNIFLISSFILELVMILVFLEIIEINFCELNKNLKRNIESRGIIDSSLSIGINADDNDSERNEKIMKAKEK